MAISRDSSNPLRMLNAILASNRADKRSENQNALSALMFNIRREDAQMARVDSALKDPQDSLKDEYKGYEEQLLMYRQLGGTKDALQKNDKGLSSDAYSILGLTQARIADDVGAKKLALANTVNTISQFRDAKKEISGRVGTYYEAAGTVAAKLFNEKGIDGSDVTEDEIRDFLNQPQVDKDGKEIKGTRLFGDEKIGMPLFMSGLRAGLAREKQAYSDQQYRESLARNNRRSGVDKKRSELLSLNKEWRIINNVVNGKVGNQEEALIRAMGGDVEVTTGMSREEKIKQLYEPFMLSVKAYENAYGVNIADKYTFPEDKEEGDEEFNKLLTEFFN